MKRILSLLPSTTEVLFALNAQRSLVGITHECDYPEETMAYPHVTSAKINPSMKSSEIDRLVKEQLDDSGTLYQLDMEVVRSLEPQIVLTQQLCTVCAVGFETVRSAMNSLDNPPEVINIEPHTLDEVFESFLEISRLAEVPNEGVHLVKQLRSEIDHIPKGNGERVLFLEWLLPPFSAGHWIGDLIESAGGTPVLANRGEYSRELSWKEIAESTYDLIVLSACGFSVERAIEDIKESEDLQSLMEARPSIPLFVFDGNHYFSRPGPRLVESVRLLSQAIRGEIAPFNA